MHKKTIAVLALCLATVVSQAPIAGAQTPSGGGVSTNSFKCC